MIRFEFFESYDIAPYADQLQELEDGISYPIEGDRFTIDHGDDYHPFFSNMGAARFLLAFDDDRVIGVVTAVWLDTEFEGRTVPSVYVADLKIDPDYRGSGLSAKMGWFATRSFFSRSDLSGWELVFGAAMQGATGDVMNIVSGAHPGGWFRPVATLGVYFVESKQLRELPTDIPQFDLPYIDLSPTVPALTTTTGTKDLRLMNQKTVWQLAHLNMSPSLWQNDKLLEFLPTLHTDATICFAVDRRLALHRWLARHGVTEGASCKVYGMETGPQRFSEHPVFLATSRI